MSSTDRSGTLWSGFVAPVCAASLVAAVAVAMTASWALQQLGAGPGVVASPEVFSWTENLNWRSAPTSWPEAEALAQIAPESLPSLVPKAKVRRGLSVSSSRAIAKKATPPAALETLAATDTESDQSRAEWLHSYRNWHAQFRIALESPLESDSAPAALASLEAKEVNTQVEYSSPRVAPSSQETVSSTRALVQKRVALRQKALAKSEAFRQGSVAPVQPQALVSTVQALVSKAAPAESLAMTKGSEKSSDQVLMSAAFSAPATVERHPATERVDVKPNPSLTTQSTRDAKSPPQVAAATDSLSSRSKSSVGASVSSQAAVVPAASSPSSVELQGEYSKVSLASVKSSPGKMSIRVKAVDAFDETREAQAQVRTLSYQGAAQRSSAPWVRIESPESWPVIAQAQAGAHALSVPVLTKNSVLLLARGQGLSVMPSGAVVYGKVPSGKRVRISGRSEEPIYWSRPDGTRWFMILNAAPGASVLQMDSGEAVAVPALEASAVYLDLRDVRTETVAGRVFDGSQAKPTWISGAWVSLVGQSGKRVQTDAQGRFRLEGVRRVGQYPLHIEVSQGTEFVHRYEAAQNLQDLSLFRFPAASIQTWVKQLEGGVSSESGMVLAAFPGWSQSKQKARYTASLYPVQVGQGLVPETYSLDSLDRLQPGRALDPASPRALAVQVPQGLNLLKLVPESGKSPAWTQWVFSSPGVVNVILAQ